MKKKIVIYGKKSTTSTAHRTRLKRALGQKHINTENNSVRLKSAEILRQREAATEKKRYIIMMSGKTRITSRAKETTTTMTITIIITRTTTAAAAAAAATSTATAVILSPPTD